MIEEIFTTLEQIPNFYNYFYAGILMLPRFLGFMLLAPGIGRKEIPHLAKIAFALMMTMFFLGDFENTSPPPDTSFIVSIVLNFTFGLLIGFIAATIFATIQAAGEMVNMQMGLQSAVMFDQNSKGQTGVMGRFYMYLGTVIFIQIGGLFWIFMAFQRGFDIFPLYETALPLAEITNLDYIIFLTGNVLFIGLQIASPIIITTLCQDLILGIISKIAPQVNVFQLSFLFKPLVGALIMFIILPLSVNAIIDYFYYFARIY